jgi:hypothetical protein
MTATETRWRDALLSSIIEAPGDGLPALRDADLRAFWPRFEATAPIHVRLGLRAATLVLGGALPFALGYGRPMSELDDAARAAVIARAYATRGLADLVEVAKIVACLAYFADPEIERTARRRT